MKSNKDTVYEFIQNYFKLRANREEFGLSTIFIAEQLGIQRTNLSAILNKLVDEGKIEKSIGRPVLYKPIVGGLNTSNETSCFKYLIGLDASLKNAVQLAKAAILYPHNSLTSLITGAPGTGKSYFAKLMYEFAVENEVLENNAPFIKLNCRHYIDTFDLLHKELFSESTYDFTNLFDRANNGMLFIDHFDLLPPLTRTQLIDFLETKTYQALGTSTRITCSCILVLACDDTAPQNILDSFVQKIPIRVILPSLNRRTLEERFQLIQHFFKIEATQIGRTIEINSELLRSLLLYECPQNVKQLQNDVKIGCANAYVRYMREEGHFKVFISDFESYVRKGFLYYKKYRDEIEHIIPQSYHYAFNSNSMERSKLNELDHQKQSFYDEINTRIVELQSRGIEQSDINQIISVELENSFSKYRTALIKQAVNKEQLSKLVSPKLITYVENFLNEASIRYDVIYPSSIFYGLCLHLNSTLNKLDRMPLLSNEQIMEIVEENKDEYAFCLRFTRMLENKLNIKLPIDEVVFITMFLIGHLEERKSEASTVVLIIMHGNSAANSIAETVNSLVKCDNAYAYDMSLDKPMQEAYEDIKDKIELIHRGKGIIVIYDMGSIKTMCESIALETGIEIRMINVPITLLALDTSRKISMGNTMDAIVESVRRSTSVYIDAQTLKNTNLKEGEVIVTLCNTGMGGANQLMHYLRKNPSLDAIEIIPLAQNDRLKLQVDIRQIQEHKTIRWLVGTYDPNLSIPFIPISKVFETEVDHLDKLFNYETNEVDGEYAVIYEYLSEQLKHVEIRKLKRFLPNVIKEIRKEAQNKLSRDQELGLFIHIACSINRILSHERCPINLQKEIILTKYEHTFKEVIRMLKPLERSFDLIFSDDEIANIVSIIKQL